MPAERSDEQLLADFAGGRSAALGELARRYERALLGLAAGLLGGRRELACDAVQEAWVRVIRFAGRFRGESRFKTWMYRIVINQCRTLLDNERALADGVGGSPAGASGEDCPGFTEQSRDPGPAPAGAAHAAKRESDEGETEDALRRAVAALPEERRAIILLCYHEGLTHPEAAEVLQIPPGTLKSRLHAALGELRELLGKEAPA